MKQMSLIFLFLIGALLITSCNDDSGEKNEVAVQPVDIKIETLQPSLLVDYIQVAGTVKALEDAMISPEEGGVVKAWVASKGKAVHKGDLIILLKDEVAKASYEAALAQYRMADLNAEKQKKVYEEHGISELQYKNLLYTRDAAKANADLMKARFDRTRITSPIDGIVDNIIPNVGEYAPPGIPIARVVNIAAVKIQAEIPEQFSGSVSHGTPAIITVDAFQGDTLRGNVSFVGSTVSAANRTLLVEIVINNTNKKLKPEMVTKVRLLREVKKNAIMINDALVQLVDRDKRIVYVEEQGKAVERVVETGGHQKNMVEIVNGLHAGDRLIVTGFQKLVNGTPVVIME